MSLHAAAQNRAIVRLIAENRDRYRRIYADAPEEMLQRKRQGWARKQLTLEFSERYQKIYAEENARIPHDESRTINPDVVASASGPGPWHAVLAGGSATACGRVRFQTYAVTADRQVNCTYCVDGLQKRSSRNRIVDPQFGEHAASARTRLDEFVELHARAAAARIAALEALGPLCTPPQGTDERAVLAKLLSDAHGAGLKLREVGKSMKLSNQRISQIAAEASPNAGGWS